MYQRVVVAAAAFAAVSATPALAIVVTPSFSFEGSVQIEGGAVENFGPEYPTGTIRRSDGGDFPDSFATLTGLGVDDPVDGVTFANGSNAFGEARASSNGKIEVVVKNDLGVAQQITWMGTIFEGGVGIVEANLFSEGCPIAALDQCVSYLAPPSTHGASASMSFGASLDGASLYSGSLFIDAMTMTDISSNPFSGIELENLRVSPDNPDYFWWDRTEFSVDLGIFAPGEEKTLEFFVNTSVIASGSDGCYIDFIEGSILICTGAQSGFGDPDSNGGVIMFRSLSYTSAPADEQFSAEAIPAPAGIWLFLTAIGAGFGAKRFRKTA
ncbi:MAG: hypothetical protein HKN14_09895 [Marinicaulis sp.]|nr:hypothetical protein [Marinicaulis sp.]NNL88358.1 hypothetical protein [Marinicaulis sp.]